jgi:transglutaminase-like putative cysteine protease
MRRAGRVDANLDELRRSTEFLDHDTPAVRDFVRRALPEDAMTDVEQAVALYYAVRDRILYEVYGADLSRQGLRASAIVRRGAGFCVHKSILYAAAVRAAGVPSRIVLAEVRNHLASDRLRRLAGGDVFLHCLTSIHVGGRWVKATPVFNKTLCRLYRIAPLEFDGRADSIHHPYDESGQRHMELVRTHGEFDDLPYETVVNGLRTLHPRLFESRHRLTGGSLVAEARAVQESAGGSDDG